MFQLILKTEDETLLLSAHTLSDEVINIFLHSVFTSPFAGVFFELLLVGLVEASDIGNERIVGVGVGQQGADGEEDLGDGEGGGPGGLLEDVEADTTILVDVGVVDLGDELDAGRGEGVLGGELDLQEEEATGVGRAFGSEDGGAPVEEVLFVFGTGGDICGRFALNVNEFLLDTFESHDVELEEDFLMNI